MAYTIVSGTGSNVAGGTNPTPAYPATGMGAGKLAFLQAGVKNDANGTLVPPANWTQRGTTVTLNNGTEKSAIFSRELDGTETAGSTITVTSAGSQGRRAAIIYVVDTPGGTGWNFEDIDSETSAASTTISDNNVTTGGSNRLAMNFIHYVVRQIAGQENFVGETGGSWISSGYFESGANPTLSLQTAELASAGTIGGGQDTSITQSAWIIHGMSIWRNSSALPDLTVTDISWDADPVAVGKPVTFSATIANTGSGASPQGIMHGVKFEVGGVAVAHSTSWYDSIPATSGTAVVYADGVWTPTSSGSGVNVVATVDYSGIITESNDANNQRTETIDIIDLPDLVITDITYTPASPVIGDNVVFSASVDNVGLGASPAVVHKVNFEVAGTLVATSVSHSSSIAASGNAVIEADAGWTPGSAGTFAVVATVDPDNTIYELEDGNNNYSENITIGVPSTGNITSFAGRGPNASGEIWPILSDYNEFFLTQGEGDDRYLQSIPEEYLTVTEADARYLQSVPSEYITQTEANAQGMPALESVAYSGGSTPPGPVTHGTGNITLRQATTPADYMQSRENTGASAITVNKPSGYLDTFGSTTINAGQSGLFIKEAGTARFRRRG